MKLIITIDLDNNAFYDERSDGAVGYEVSGVLRRLSNKSSGLDVSGLNGLFENDSNGEMCCTVEVQR